MSIENCKNLLYKRGPLAIAFAIGAVLAATASIVIIDPSKSAPAALPAVRPPAFLPAVRSLPAAAKHVQQHVQAHVRAVRRRHDPKPKAPSRATISLYESSTSRSVFRAQGWAAANRGG